MPLIRALVIGPAHHAEKLKQVHLDRVPAGHERDFVILHRQTEDTLEEDLAEFRPHAIIIEPDAQHPGVIDPVRYPKLGKMPLPVRGRCITSLDDSAEQIGADVMANFFGPLTVMGRDRFKDMPLVSVFTPTYKTGNAELWRAYKSLCAQSYDNWEWVVYDDSGPAVKDTLKTLTQIARKDFRVRVYTGIRNSGSIGEVKRNCAGLCRGEILVELDHDDELTSECLQHLVKAFAQFPDAGFAYTNCLELQAGKPRERYQDGWAWGYGSYSGDIVVMPEINCKTIRHIVSTPNHARAWRTSAYWQAGGHDPRIDAGDDYELMVRTFLVTRFVHVNVCGYVQHYHASNSQSTRLAEINRIVIFVRSAYESRIHARLLELGVPDFVYVNENTLDYSRKCDASHHCQYTYQPEEAGKKIEPLNQASVVQQKHLPDPRPGEFSLAIVTACSRPKALSSLQQSLGTIPIHWIIVQDATITNASIKDQDKEIQETILRRVPFSRICLKKNSAHTVTDLLFCDPTVSHAGGQCCKNMGLEYVLKQSKEKWVYFLDDDNILFPGFVEQLKSIAERASAPLIVWRQHLEDRTRPIDIRVGHIDQAQYAVRTDCIGDERIPLDYRGDGMFIQKMAALFEVHKHQAPLCYYNRLSWSLPVF